MPNLSEQVNSIIGKDKALQDQFQQTRQQMTILLDMINMRLQKKGEYCHAYTLTVTAGDVDASYRKH
jgi:hypothetical protein